MGSTGAWARRARARQSTLSVTAAAPANSRAVQYAPVSAAVGSSSVRRPGVGSATGGLASARSAGGVGSATGCLASARRPGVGSATGCLASARRGFATGFLASRRAGGGFAPAGLASRPPGGGGGAFAAAAFSGSGCRWLRRDGLFESRGRTSLLRGLPCGGGGCARSSVRRKRSAS